MISITGCWDNSRKTFVASNRCRGEIFSRWSIVQHSIMSRKALWLNLYVIQMVKAKYLSFIKLGHPTKQILHSRFPFHSDLGPTLSLGKMHFHSILRRKRYLKTFCCLAGVKDITILSLPCTKVDPDWQLHLHPTLTIQHLHIRGHRTAEKTQLAPWCAYSSVH